MSVKVISIGNVLMGDDGIGIKVLSKIENTLKRQGIQTINGETDCEYCLSQIERNDTVFIIDAAVTGKEIGSVNVVPIDKNLNFYSQSMNGKNSSHSLTQHSGSLIKLINIYHKNISGYIICIEAKDISYCPDISTELQNLLENISDRVLSIILNLVEIKKH